MSAQLAPANLNTEPGPRAPGQQAADAHDYRQVLHELIDMGAGLARLLHQQATSQAAQLTAAPAAPQPPAPQPEPPATPTPNLLISIAAAFDRIARAVRRSIALARSLDALAPPARDPAQHRAAARRRILREVEDTIQRTAPGSANATPAHAALDGFGTDAADPNDVSAAALTAELHDRLDTPDLNDDLSSRPVADIITEICRDLGLATPLGAHPWKRRTPNDLEQLRARAAAPRRVCPPDAGPLAPAARQHTETNPVPPGPAATLHANGPIHTGSGPPNGPADTPIRSPAEAITLIPRHPMHLHGQWRPPPEPQQTFKGPHRQLEKLG